MTDRIMDKLVERYLEIAAGGLDEEYTSIVKEGGREAAYGIIRKLLQTLADNLDEGALEASFKEWDKEDWPGWSDTVAAIQAYLNHIKGDK